MEVSTVERRRNLLVCETEAVICDKSLLTTAETEKVASIEKEQNQVNCEAGTETCDYSLLTPMEAVRVRLLEREHNLLACQTGDPQCKPADVISRSCRLSAGFVLATMGWSLLTQEEPYTKSEHAEVDHPLFGSGTVPFLTIYAFPLTAGPG
jgi:hypothetical protein